MRQEGYISDQELNNDLKKKIDDSNTNSILAKQQIGNLASLKTTNKNTLVVAVNEVKDSISTVVNDTLGSATLTTNDKTIKGAINEVKDNINVVVNNTLGNATLATNDKTIKGAINEAFRFANDGKSVISSVIGSPTDSNNTFNQMKDNIQLCKNNLTANLNTKGIGATSNESLLTLVSKVANITATTLGGKQYETDNVYLDNKIKEDVFTLKFKPHDVVIYGGDFYGVISSNPGTGKINDGKSGIMRLDGNTLTFKANEYANRMRFRFIAFR